MRMHGELTTTIALGAQLFTQNYHKIRSCEFACKRFARMQRSSMRQIQDQRGPHALCFRTVFQWRPLAVSRRRKRSDLMTRGRIRRGGTRACDLLFRTVRTTFVPLGLFAVCTLERGVVPMAALVPAQLRQFARGRPSAMKTAPERL